MQTSFLLSIEEKDSDCLWSYGGGVENQQPQFLFQRLGQGEKRSEKGWEREKEMGREKEKEWERKGIGGGVGGHLRMTFEGGAGWDGRGIQHKLRVETSQRLRFSFPGHQRLPCRCGIGRGRTVGAACGGLSLCG